MHLVFITFKRNQFKTLFIMNYFLRINFKQFHKKIQYFVNVNGVYSVLKSGGKMHNLISPKKEKKTIITTPRINKMMNMNTSSI